MRADGQLQGDCFIGADLGERRTVSALAVEWGRYRPASGGYRLEYSEDGLTWTQARGAASFGSGQERSRDQWTLSAPVTAQFVRVNITRLPRGSAAPVVYALEIYDRPGGQNLARITRDAPAAIVTPGEKNADKPVENAFDGNQSTFVELEALYDEQSWELLESYRVGVRFLRPTRINALKVEWNGRCQGAVGETYVYQITRDGLHWETVETGAVERSGFADWVSVEETDVLGVRLWLSNPHSRDIKMPTSICEMRVYHVVPFPSYQLTIDENISGGKITVPQQGHTLHEHEWLDLVVQPEEGKRLVEGSLRLNGEAVMPSENGVGGTLYNARMPAGDAFITAQFEDVPADAPQYSISIRADQSQGGVSLSTTQVRQGEMVDVYVTPTSGMKLEDIYMCGIPLKPMDGGTYRFIMQETHDIWVAVRFTQAEDGDVNAISVDDAIQGGTVTSPAQGTVGSSVVLDVRPETGMQVKAIHANDEPVPLRSGKYSFVMPDQAVRLTAEFEKIRSLPAARYPVQLDAAITGGKIVCSVSDATPGQMVTLRAVPDAGMRLVAGSLRVNGQTLEQTEGGYQFVMPQGAATVTAQFEAIPPAQYRVYVRQTAGGTLQASGETAPAGATVSVAVHAEDGYDLARLLLDGQPLEADDMGEYRFVMPARQVTVSAEFVFLPQEDDVPLYKMAVPEGEENRGLWIARAVGASLLLVGAVVGIAWWCKKYMKPAEPSDEDAE